MENTKTKRPCLEIRLEISNITKNIEYIDKKINDWVYSGYDLENLKNSLNWQRERLSERVEKLKDCK